MPGSKSYACSKDGKCTCKIGYEGDKCSECANEYYKTQAGCTGIIFMFGLMCLSLQLAVADFCMIHKVLGSVCCRLFGKIMEIAAHYFGRHLQIVTSSLYTSMYFMS